MQNFGDKLYEIINITKGKLFDEGELAQLTHQAFHEYTENIKNSKEEEITISFPVGYRPTKETIESERKYTKEQLIDRYNFLGFTQLPINGIYNVITLIEAMFIDLLRTIIMKYPQKISNKKQVNISTILSLNSIEEIHLQVINKLLNELAYKSPEEFIKEFETITSVNLLESISIHKYKEIKATRDIYIHNNGIANEIYLTKANTLARAKDGEALPITIQYFLESYEYCLQLTEFLEQELHKIWPSEELDKQ